MKKNKNDTAKANITRENTESFKSNDIPSENKKADNNKERELPFRKVLYGYNPDEVQAFIDELTKSCEASLKLHESKLSAMKEELAFSNRERDRYIEKCKAYQLKMSEKSPSVENNAEEYEATVSHLTQIIKKLKSENDSLRNSRSVSPADSADKYTEKISLLENRNKEIENALLSAESKNTELSNEIEKYASVSAEYKSLMQELEETKSRLSLCKNELKNKCDELEEKESKINALAEEKNSLEKKITELEVENGVLSQRIAQSEDETSKLRETNKAIIFENAEKINALENEQAKNKLAVQKELKLYGYYVDRAELTVAELTKQLEQLKQSINNSEI